MFSSVSPTLMAIVGLVVLLVLLVLLITSRYKVAGPNEAFIVTGRKGRSVRNVETGVLSTDLSGQKVQAVPEAILRYPQLEYLDLRDTPIAFLPSWLLRMPRLREIYCDRGVEYNDAFLRKGLMVYRDEKRDPPRPGEEPPPWQANLSGFSAALPVAISVEGLKDKH